MTAAEEGVLLLCSRLGDPDSKPLTMPQFRELGLRVRSAGLDGDPLRQLQEGDLLRLGYEKTFTRHILQLLDRNAALTAYLRRGEQIGIHPLTRLSSAYPHRFRNKQGASCPPVLFYRGNTALLEQPSLALVGSRALQPENEAFARYAGRFAAMQNLVLVSGGAVGADLTAQNACLDAGGSCVIFLPDQLDRHPAHDRILYLCADGYDLPFSTPRALGRNALIHMQADRTIAAQCTYGSGGTWQGCLENLKHSWSDLFVFADGSDGANALVERGASPLPSEFSEEDLKKSQLSLF